MDKKPVSITRAPRSVFWEQRGDEMRRVGEVPLQFRDVIYATIQEVAQPMHGNAEPVRVVSVDEREAVKWYPPRAQAREVHEEQVFPSAMAASLHMGFKNNEVGHRLARARRRDESVAAAEFGPEHTVRLRPSVTIRGVTFMYERDVPG